MDRTEKVTEEGIIIPARVVGVDDFEYHIDIRPIRSKAQMIRVGVGDKKRGDKGKHINWNNADKLEIVIRKKNSD